ncbi:MAG: serine/threonine protein kinase [Gemmataceae bacterium]|nr:serine/threonine protein kinase [Gemmataceae bacterium]
MDKIGKFQIIQELGTGAHSRILHVRRDEDGKDYALKLVPIEDEDDKKYLDQAKHEYRVGQMLNHPNLAKVYCLELKSGWFSGPTEAKLLIEFVPGKPLDQHTLLRPAKLLRVAERVADAVTHMHKQGVIHADLKPHNLMLGRGTNVKVIDYGLAWIKAEPKDRVQGTPEYMAPETGTHKLVNERTDIYNLGATLYRLATLQNPPVAIALPGGLPPTDKSFRDALKPVRKTNPTIPPAFADLIERCLSFNANRRPERMSEVQGLLDQLADEAAATCDPADLEE